MSTWLVAFDSPEPGGKVIYLRPDIVVGALVEKWFGEPDRYVAALRTQRGGTVYGQFHGTHTGAMVDLGEFMRAIDDYVREVTS